MLFNYVQIDWKNMKTIENPLSMGKKPLSLGLSRQEQLKLIADHMASAACPWDDLKLR